MSKIDGSLTVDFLYAKSGVSSPGGISNDSITSDPTKRVSAAKLQQQYTPSVMQLGGTAIVTASTIVHIAQGDGTLEDVLSAIETVATGADRTVTIDVKKSHAGGSFASMLSSTVVFNNGSTARTVVTGTISSGAYLAGDLIQITVTVAGSASAQAQGLNVSLVLREDPE